MSDRLKFEISAKQLEAEEHLNAWRSRVDARDSEGAAKAKVDFERSNGALQALNEQAEQAEQLAKAEQGFRSVDPAKRSGLRSPESASKQFTRERRIELTRSVLPTFFRDGLQAAASQAQAAGYGPQEIATLISADSTKGGIIVGPDVRAEILKDLPGASVMRRICRVEMTSSDVLSFPAVVSATSESHARTSTLEANGSWQPEQTTPSTQDFSTEGTDIPVHDWIPDIVKAGPKLLRNSGATLETLIGELLLEVYDADLDKACLTGDGAGKPMGLMETSGITTVNSLHATQLTWAGLINLIYTLPAQWRNGAKLLMSSLTYASFLGLEDGAGNPIITANSAPNTILGYPVEFSEYMPAIAASAYPIAFGNFRNYVIAEGANRVIQRMDQPYFPSVGFGCVGAVGGAVTRKKAFVFQKISA